MCTHMYHSYSCHFCFCYFLRYTNTNLNTSGQFQILPSRFTRNSKELKTNKFFNSSESFLRASTNRAQPSKPFRKKIAEMALHGIKKILAKSLVLKHYEISIYYLSLQCVPDTVQVNKLDYL